MKLALGILFLFTANTWAADSAWLVCDDGKISFQVFEHRDSNGVDRDTDLTLIYGGYQYRSQLQSNDPSAQPDKSGFQSVWINGQKEDEDEFHGLMKIDYNKPSVTLKGEAWFGGTRFDINSTLKCKEMGRL